MTGLEQITDEMRLAQWRKTHRKGETPPNFGDTRTKSQKHMDKQKSWRDRISLDLFKTERRKVIEAKIKHFEETGNQRKLNIYRAKLNMTPKTLAEKTEQETKLKDGQP